MGVPFGGMGIGLPTSRHAFLPIRAGRVIMRRSYLHAVDGRGRAAWFAAPRSIALAWCANVGPCEVAGW